MLSEVSGKSTALNQNTILQFHCTPPGFLGDWVFMDPGRIVQSRFPFPKIFKSRSRHCNQFQHPAIFFLQSRHPALKIALSRHPANLYTPPSILSSKSIKFERQYHFGNGGIRKKLLSRLSYLLLV